MVGNPSSGAQPGSEGARPQEHRVVIMGGYGSLGSELARILLKVTRLHVEIAGRDRRRAEELAVELEHRFGAGRVGVPRGQSRSFKHYLTFSR